MARSGIDVSLPYCSENLQRKVPVFKKDYKIWVAESRTNFLKNFPDFQESLSECFRYTYDTCLMMCGMTVKECESRTHKCVNATCHGHKGAEECEEAAAGQWKAAKM